MNTLILKKENLKETKELTKLRNPFKLLWDSYIKYAAANNSENIYWYMKAIIIIPCGVMVPTTTLMYLSTPNFVWFICVSMILFFANVIVHTAELKSTIYIPLYHFSIAIMTLIPSITYLLNL